MYLLNTWVPTRDQDLTKKKERKRNMGEQIQMQGSGMLFLMEIKTELRQD